LSAVNDWNALIMSALLLDEKQLTPALASALNNSPDSANNVSAANLSGAESSDLYLEISATRLIVSLSFNTIL